MPQSLYEYAREFFTDRFDVEPLDSIPEGLAQIGCSLGIPGSIMVDEDAAFRPTLMAVWAQLCSAVASSHPGLSMHQPVWAIGQLPGNVTPAGGIDVVLVTETDCMVVAAAVAAMEAAAEEHPLAHLAPKTVLGGDAVPWGDLSESDLLKEMGTDAQKWAAAFNAIDPEPDAVPGWFANAIEASRAAAPAVPKWYDVAQDELKTITQEDVDRWVAAETALYMGLNAIEAVRQTMKGVAAQTERPIPIAKLIGDRRQPQPELPAGQPAREGRLT